MLSDVEIDALYARIERPFSREELDRFSCTPERRTQHLFEETNYHNFALIDLTTSWSDYLAGMAPKPSANLADLLTPGLSGENAARARFNELATVLSNFPHGHIPRIAIIPQTLRSSFALIDRLTALHPTTYLAAAREQLRAIKDLFAYTGEPLLRHDEFAEKLRTSFKSFHDNCAYHAAEVRLWLRASEEKREETMPPRTTCAPARRRLGSGLKGSRTERMVEQLADFKEWLRDNPVNERIAARTVGARASIYWRLHEKTFAKDATRTGEKRGFSSPKTLASAYRNSKA